MEAGITDIADVFTARQLLHHPTLLGCGVEDAGLLTPGGAASLPTAFTTAPVCMRRLPASVTGLSRSSNAPLTRLAFNCCHGDGSSNELSLGSIETAAWQRISSAKAWVYIA